MSIWHPISSGLLPQPETPILVWNVVRQQPQVVFLDPDTGSWWSQADGDEVNALEISHWAVVDGPASTSTAGVQWIANLRPAQLHDVRQKRMLMYFTAMSLEAQDYAVDIVKDMSLFAPAPRCKSRSLQNAQGDAT